MQIERIIIRPSQNKLTIQYSDEANRMANVVVDTTNDAKVAAVISQAQQKIPAPQDRPDKAQIEKEITALEARLQGLKESIDAA